MRIGSWLLLPLLLVVAGSARATSFGTASTAAIDLPGDLFDGSTTETTVDMPVSASSAWLTDGTTSAGAITPFGANDATVISAPGTTAFAASRWTDTFTLTSSTGATGSAHLVFRIGLRGALDAGAVAGGYAQVALRSYLGLPGPDDALVPSIVLGAANLVRDDRCDGGGLLCDPSPVAMDELLVIHADVPYDTPFRFGVLLETIAWGGGSADFEPSSGLRLVTMPSGGWLTSASGSGYSDCFEVVPEPGTLGLVGTGLAALASRRRSA